LLFSLGFLMLSCGSIVSKTEALGAESLMFLLGSG
jgi:hypothetical protein